MSTRPAPTKHQLGQLRHLDLLALVVQRVPRIGDATACYYGSLSKDGLIDLLTRRAGR